MQIEGKVAVITGGANGIGFGIAQALGARGAKLALIDRQAGALDPAVERLTAEGVEAIGLVTDVCDRAAMAQAAQAIEDRFGGVDIVCNNAGVVLRGALDEMSYDDWDWVLGVNLGGMINGVVTFVPRLKARGGGHIVNTASMMGLLASPGWGVYATGKFAAVGMSEALRIDLAPYGIGVSVLCPGLVATNLLNSAQNRSGAVLADPNQGVTALKSLKPGEAIEPRAVGERVAEAIAANQPYICTHPEYYDAVAERYGRVLDALRPSASTNSSWSPS